MFCADDELEFWIDEKYDRGILNSASQVCGLLTELWTDDRRPTNATRRRTKAPPTRSCYHTQDKELVELAAVMAQGIQKHRESMFSQAP